MAQPNKARKHFAIRRISDGYYFVGGYRRHYNGLFTWSSDQYVFTSQQSLNTVLGQQLRGRTWSARGEAGRVGGEPPDNVEIVEFELQEADVTDLVRWSFAERVLNEHG